jgi:4'-phosphopantetheinyl transferase
VVQIWTIHAAAFDCVESGKVLNPAERARAARYRFDEDRQRFISGRASLRRILAQRTSTRAEDLVIEEVENQKPRLVGPPGAPQIFFNVSHSGEYAVIAVSESAELGIDIEQIYADCPIHDLARRYYAALECEWLRKLQKERRLRGFYRLWTIKEAVLKCAGLGLSVPPQTVQVRLGSDVVPAITCLDSSHKAIERFRVREFQVVDGYASALAVAADSEIEVLLTRL